MGARLGGNIGDDLAETHEINVTPFIDVMLVPSSSSWSPRRSHRRYRRRASGVDGDAAAASRQPVFITVKPDLSVAVGENIIPRTGLSGALDAATNGKKTDPVFLRADKTVPYGELMDVMNLLRNAGYLKVALVGLDARN